jgi:hypothetical protein
MPRPNRRRRPSPSSSSSDSGVEQAVDTKANAGSPIPTSSANPPTLASPTGSPAAASPIDPPRSPTVSTGENRDAASAKSGASGPRDYDQDSIDSDYPSADVADAVAGPKSPVGNDAKHSAGSQSHVGDDGNHPGRQSPVDDDENLKDNVDSAALSKFNREESPSLLRSPKNDDDGSNDEDDCIVTGITPAPEPENSPVSERAAAGAGAGDVENFTVVKTTTRASQNKTPHERAAASEPSQTGKHARASEAITPTKATTPTSASKHANTSEPSLGANSPAGSPVETFAGTKPKADTSARSSETVVNTNKGKMASASEPNKANVPPPGKMAASSVGSKLNDAPAKGGEGKLDKAAPLPQKQDQDHPKLNPLVGRVGGGNHPSHPEFLAAKVSKGVTESADTHAAKKGERRQLSPSPPPNKTAKTQGGSNAPAVTSPANPASPNPAKQGEDMVMELQRKLAATENMLRATQEQAGYQRELLTLHKEQIADYREKVVDLAEQQQLQENIIFSMQQQAQAEPPKPSKFARLEDPQNAKRLEYLVAKGYTVTESMQALEDTRSPDGNFSSLRAETHLKANAEAEQADVVRRANALNGDSAIPEILPNSAVAHLLTHHEDAVDMVTKLREVHAKSRSKNMHSGKSALSAACLVEVPSVKSDSSLLRKGLNFLCQVASAVSEDCGKCKELRDQLEQEARWAKEKEKAAALKAKNEQERKRLTAKTADEKKRQREMQPHVINFKICDSKRDVTLRRGVCGKCSKGATNTDAWLYYCGHCHKGYHLLCTALTLIRYNGDEYFACSTCLDDLDEKLREGDTTPFTVIGSDIGRGKAPGHIESEEDQAPPPPPVERTLGGGGAARNSLFQTPPHANPTSTRVVDPSDHTSAVTGKKNADDGVSGGNVPVSGSKNSDSKTNVTVKDYFIWEPVPKDWTPKADPKDPKSETLLDHPEKGYNKLACQNWMRRNINARDVVRSNNGSLGPLTRALSAEMKITLGTQFLTEPALSWLWPHPVMTDKDIDKWVTDDPGFKWVEQIPDETLIDLLNKRFGVKRNDLFLTKRFPSDLPPTNEKGEVNYHVATFNRWMTDWQNELAELRLSGCTFEGVNLRQTLINALATNPMLYAQATVFQTESIHALIAHLRDWLMREEENYIAMRNKQQSILNVAGANVQNAQQAAAPAQQHLLAAAGGGRANAPAPHRNAQVQSASALITQLMEQQKQLLESITANAAGGGGGAAAGGGAAGGHPGNAGKRLPAHLVAESDTVAKCRGCNNTWNRNRKIPCFPGCKYADHPHYNKNCKTQEAPHPTIKLTWAGFKERFPTVTPPQGYLEWEAYISQKDARAKRDRDGNPKP